jgi:hypothetical protein
VTQDRRDGNDDDAECDEHDEMFCIGKNISEQISAK